MGSSNPNPHEMRNFSTLLSSLEDGQLHSELSEAITEVVAAIQDHARDIGGKPKGSINLKIDFKMDSGMIEIISDLKVSKPKPVRSKTMLWATPDNNLTARNPKQHELPLRDVTASSSAVRTVS